MKCYELAPRWDYLSRQYYLEGGNITEGIPLNINANGVIDVIVTSSYCNTDTRHGRAVLSDALRQDYLDTKKNGTFSHVYSRLHRCDFEVRNVPWLLPETDEHRNDAIILFWHLSDHSKRACIPIECYICDPAKAEILIESELTTGAARGKAYLIHLRDGGQIEAEWTHTAKKKPGAASFWFSSQQTNACVVSNIGGSLALITGGGRVATAGMRPAKPAITIPVPIR